MILFMVAKIKRLVHLKADCQGFYDGDKIYSIEIIDGYGARLSAPGYMDCTEWTVFKTQEQAQNYLNETYDD